jgi:hypothetical protein
MDGRNSEQCPVDPGEEVRIRLHPVRRDHDDSADREGVLIVDEALHVPPRAIHQA